MPLSTTFAAPARRSAWIALLVAATGASTAGYAAEAPSDCHSILDPTGRLLCYDRVTGRPEPVLGPAAAAVPSPTPRPDASAPAAPTTMSAPAIPSASPETGPTTASAAPAQPQSTRGLPAPIPPPAEIAPSKIVKLEQTSVGRYRFHLENGEVWEQLEPGRITVREGDVVGVKEGRFGNWTLRASDNSSRSVRVRRYQ